MYTDGTVRDDRRFFAGAVSVLTRTTAHRSAKAGEGLACVLDAMEATMLRQTSDWNDGVRTPCIDSQPLVLKRVDDFSSALPNADFYVGVADGRRWNGRVVDALWNIVANCRAQ